MSIIVEDGTIVEGANSFVSLVDFQVHCDARGRDYSSYDDESLQEPALIKMADYLNDLPYKGFKTDRANPMSWPRYGSETGGGNYVNILLYPETYFVGVLDRDGYWVGIAEIPVEVINAQCEGTWLILTGKEMEPALARGGQTKREKYDVIEFEYFNGAPTTTEFKAVMNRLRGLLKSSTTMDVSRG